MRLPEHIVKSLLDGRTSLSDHPAFPPEDDEKFVVRMVRKWFEANSSEFDDVDPKSIRRMTGRLMSYCEKIEEPVREALEALCMKVVTSVFDIPDDTVSISAVLSGDIDTSAQRKVPEPTDDFGFDDIAHMERLTREVYKRRMLDSVVTGAAVDLSMSFLDFREDLDSIDPRLFDLYVKISKLSRVLLYLERERTSNDGITETGKVDVYISSSDEKVRIEAQGMIFPTMLSETIKGILEVAISRGLPENREEAVYITKKSDFAIAELWDTRLGMPIWSRIKDAVVKSGSDLSEVGANILMMEVSKMSPDDFDIFMQNVLLGTRRGVEMVGSLCSEITYARERENFDNYVRYNNDRFPIDDGYFDSGSEILGEAE